MYKSTKNNKRPPRGQATGLKFKQVNIFRHLRNTKSRLQGTVQIKPNMCMPAAQYQLNKQSAAAAVALKEQLVQPKMVG
jgi:hypothetical protein